MKKIIFFLGAAFLFTVFTAFKAPPATVIDQHFDFPGPFGFGNPCNGEFVVLDGTISEDIHVVMNGNRINVSLHESGHLTGTGDQGNDYVANVNAHETQNFSLNNGQVVFDLVVSEEFITKGGAPNFVVKQTLHVTVNANGTITVNRTDFSAECRG